MFDISWGELGLITAVGVAIVGRKDLPMVARAAGHYTGRAVGWLQGMRTRADRFTAQNELAHLQGQVRTGMRQLQAVQAEVLSASRVSTGPMSSMRPISSSFPPSSPAYTSSPNPSIGTGSTPAGKQPAIPTIPGTQTTNTTLPKMDLPPPSRTIAAVAETEWQRQGLGFTSRAEMGNYNPNADTSSPPGSVLLAKALQESLIYDQYDRVTREQQEALQQPGSGQERNSKTENPSSTASKEA